MTAFFLFIFYRRLFWCLRRSGFVVGAWENGLGARPNFLYAGKTLHDVCVCVCVCVSVCVCVYVLNGNNVSTAIGICGQRSRYKREKHLVSKHQFDKQIKRYIKINTKDQVLWPLYQYQY